MEMAVRSGLEVDDLSPQMVGLDDPFREGLVPARRQQEQFAAFPVGQGTEQFPFGYGTADIARLQRDLDIALLAAPDSRYIGDEHVVLCCCRIVGWGFKIFNVGTDLPEASSANPVDSLVDQSLLLFHKHDFLDDK